MGLAQEWLLEGVWTELVCTEWGVHTCEAPQLPGRNCRWEEKMTGGVQSLYLLS